jgi:rSAM/selenodomain-associated transferase 1
MIGTARRIDSRSSVNRTPTCAIGVMAKAPEAGRSKTRLCPPLLPEQAAAMSAAFLRDTIDNIMLAGRSAPIEAYAAYSPFGSEQLLRAHVGSSTKLLLADGNAPMPDGVEGFGRCLLQAMQDILAEGHTAACLLSSDCPSLPTRLLLEAAEILLAPGERGVLGAARDGGYYLLGLKMPHAQLFRNIAWSTSSVADETRDRAREIGLELKELDIWYDVDDAASLEILIEEREGYAAPRTKEIIALFGLQPQPRFQTQLGRSA